RLPYSAHSASSAVILLLTRRSTPADLLEPLHHEVQLRRRGSVLLGARLDYQEALAVGGDVVAGGRRQRCGDGEQLLGGAGADGRAARRAGIDFYRHHLAFLATVEKLAPV